MLLWSLHLGSTQRDRHFLFHVLLTGRAGCGSTTPEPIVCYKQQLSHGFCAWKGFSQIKITHQDDSQGTAGLCERESKMVAAREGGIAIRKEERNPVWTSRSSLLHHRTPHVLSPRRTRAGVRFSVAPTPAVDAGMMLGSESYVLGYLPCRLPCPVGGAPVAIGYRFVCGQERATAAEFAKLTRQATPNCGL